MIMRSLAYFHNHHTLSLQSSGLGRELGEYGLANYTEVKTVIISMAKL